jgi:hypothetical protein
MPGKQGVKKNEARKMVPRFNKTFAKGNQGPGSGAGTLGTTAYLPLR